MTGFVKRLQDICYSEWLHFGKQTYDINNRLFRAGMKETDPGFWQRVGVYWEVGTQMDLTGLDDDWPWSAAFISYVIRLAGAEDKFFYSIRHSDYINDAILDSNPFFVGQRLSDYSPKIGDLVCYSRQNGVSFDNLPEKYKSHSDIVVKVNPTFIEVIGGNVGNSVSKKHLRIDGSGKLIAQNHKWFAIVENKL
ncbi:MAG: DUF2272 domain-containing protein [Allomuricauda sp.]